MNLWYEYLHFKQNKYNEYTHDTILKKSRLYEFIIIHDSQCHLYRQFILWLETGTTQACESHYTHHDHLHQNWAYPQLHPTVGTKQEATSHQVHHVWGCDCSLKLMCLSLAKGMVMLSTCLKIGKHCWFIGTCRHSQNDKNRGIHVREG